MFNLTKDRYIGSIPLNEMIELIPEKQFLVTELYPQENRVLGTYNYGDVLLVDIDAGRKCKVIEITPYVGIEKEKIIPKGAPVQPAF